MSDLKLSKEQKDEIIDRVKVYFEEERSEALGDLGAEQIYEFIVKEIGPFFYNKAIRDARDMMNLKAVQIEDDLYAMEKPIQTQR